MKVRLAEPDDAAVVRDIYGPFVLSSPVTFELEPPSVSEMERRITERLPRFPWLVAEEGNETLGYAYATDLRTRPAYRWVAETSIYLRAEARGRGVGRRLYGVLLTVLERQGFVAAFGGITLPNEASVRMHEGMGFRPCGVFSEVGYKDGAWHDVGFWRLALRPAATSPPEPVPLAKLGREELTPLLDAEHPW